MLPYYKEDLTDSRQAFTENAIWIHNSSGVSWQKPTMLLVKPLVSKKQRDESGESFVLLENTEPQESKHISQPRRIKKHKHKDHHHQQEYTHTQEQRDTSTDTIPSTSTNTATDTFTDTDDLSRQITSRNTNAGTSATTNTNTSTDTTVTNNIHTQTHESQVSSATSVLMQVSHGWIEKTVRKLACGDQESTSISMPKKR